MIGIGHPVLTEIVGKLPVATKLSGTLSPAMQLADMHVAWSEFRQSGEVAYGPRSARWRSIEAGFVVVPIALVLLIVVGAVWNQEPRLVFRWLRWAIVPAIAVGVVTWCLIPKVEVQDPARSSYRLERDLEQLPDLVHDSLLSRSGAATVDDVRAAARAAIDLHGLQTQEEDSPHGYAVRPGADGRAVEFVLYNWCGTPMVRQVWP